MSAYDDHLWHTALSYRVEPQSEALAASQRTSEALGQPDARPEWQMSDDERRRTRTNQGERGTFWPSAAFELARLRARAEAEAFFAEELAGADDAWTPSPLALAEVLPEPTILRVQEGKFLLRPKEIALVHGLPGCGKSPLGYMGVIDSVLRGETAIIIDHEMGAISANTLLLELGLTQNQIDTHVIHYADPPSLTEQSRARIIETCAGRDVSYVLIDALAGSMPSGASQNDAADVDVYFASTPKWFAKQFDAAVLVIDHSNKDDGPNPGGSVRKQGVPHFRMWLRLEKGFSKGNEDGRSTLIVQRDRSGTYGKGEVVAELRNELREGRSAFVLRAPGSQSTVSGEDLSFDLGAMPAKHRFALEKLEDLRRYGRDGVMQSAFTGGGAAGPPVLRALEWLEQQGLAGRRPGGRNNRGRRWWAAEFLPQGDGQ